MINKISLFIFSLLILAACVPGRATEQLNTAKKTTKVELPPIYKELTIPYLRVKNYPGSKIKINSIFEENSQTISYLTSYQSDNLKINALLVKPKSEMPEGGYPAIVFLHGYIPPRTYQTAERYQDYVNYLARNGLVVFKIDYRGHGDSQGQATGAYYSAGYIIDTLNAYASLKTLDYVNPKKIGLWGHSMSGNVVLRSLVVLPQIPAGVIWDGAVYTYTDMQKYRISDSSYVRHLSTSSATPRLLDEVGQPESNSQFWQEFIPTNFVSDLQGKIQIHHATFDPVVTVEYSRNLAKILSKKNIPHEFYEYDSSDHNLGSPAFETAMSRTVEFFRKM